MFDLLKLLREEVFCSYLITELDSLSIMSWRMSSHKLRENGQISVKTSNNVSLIRWTKKNKTKKQKRHEKNKAATRKRRLNRNITLCRETLVIFSSLHDISRRSDVKDWKKDSEKVNGSQKAPCGFHPLQLLRMISI